jgi:hypothetical protein
MIRTQTSGANPPSTSALLVVLLMLGIAAVAGCSSSTPSAETVTDSTLTAPPTMTTKKSTKTTKASTTTTEPTVTTEPPSTTTTLNIHFALAGPFQPQTVGTTSGSARLMSVVNVSDSHITIDEIRLEGAAADFVFSEGTSCSEGTELAPGSRCGISARFKPTEVGRRNATLVIVPSEGQEATITLSGVGISELAPPPSPGGVTETDSGSE